MYWAAVQGRCEVVPGLGSGYPLAKLVDNLSEGGLCTRGRGASQEAWGQTQEDGRNLVAECQWEQIIVGSVGRYICQFV